MPKRAVPVGRQEKILLTIAARGGSKGVKNKNIRQLCGKPLIAYTVMQAKKWGKANRIICSTDSVEIASIAKKYGADVPFIRPRELATDTAGKLEVIRHALKAAEENYNEKYGIIIDLDVTAPIRKVSDIDGAYKLFVENRPKSVFSVTACRKNPYFNMVEVNHRGIATLVKIPVGAIKRRQDAPVVYDMNASIYAYDREYLLSKGAKSAISGRSLVWVMDALSSVDIDSELDFQFIEYLISKKLVSL